MDLRISVDAGDHVHRLLEDQVVMDMVKSAVICIVRERLQDYIAQESPVEVGIGGEAWLSKWVNADGR